MASMNNQMKHNLLGNFPNYLNTIYKRGMHIEHDFQQAKAGKDVSIAISQRVPFTGANIERKTEEGESAEEDGQAGGRESIPRERPRNQRVQPTEKEGSIDFETSQNGGVIQICIHSLFANKMGPYKVGLEVTEKVDTTDEQVDVLPQRGRSLEAAEQEIRTATKHLSEFSKEMIRAENLVRTILASADVVKKEEADFYEQSIRMEKSIHFWPMLQLTTLVVAAIVQVRHVLAWMRSKHIL